LRRIFIISLLVLGLFLIPLAAELEKTWAATVTGQALSSDIHAYVNGQMLPCLIINDRTAIVAEDLRSCGFDVIWEPVERKLEISENTSHPTGKTGSRTTTDYAAFAGKDRMILASDIKTFLQQKEIASFNIDGYTAIYLSELAAYGEVKWDPLQRVARFDSSQRSGDTILAESSEDANLIAEEIDRREGIIEFHGEKLLYQNQQVGYAHNGKAMVSLDWMAGWLGYQVQSKQNSYLVKRGSHSFQVKAGERQVQVFYDGSPAKSVELYEVPSLSSTRLYLYSLDLENLFGLDSQWNNEKRQWKVRYADYRIKESGNYLGGSSCTVKSQYLELPSGFNTPPELSVKNITLISEGYDKGGYAYVSGDGKNYAATVSLKVLGDNEIQICLGKKNRVLFYKQMTLRGEVQNHQLERQKIIGPFTEYSLVKPEQGFIQVKQNSFMVEGQVGFTNEAVIHILPAKIDQASGIITELPEQTLSLQEQKFSGPVALNAGPGLYRIYFQVQNNGLHGVVATTRFGEFYLDYH